MEKDDLLDFRNFLFLVWQELGLPEPTESQYGMADALQGPEDRIVLMAFRGAGKSWVTSVFCAFLLYHDPLLNILVVSAAGDRAKEFTTFCLLIFEKIPWLNHLHPDNGGRGLRALKTAFDVTGAGAAHAPSIKSVGITGQMAGSRADWIIADDVEIPNNSATPMMRERLSELVKEFDAIVKPGGRVIFLGTPQSQESLYSLLPRRGYATWIWPARYPTKREEAIYGESLAPELRANLIQNPHLGLPLYGLDKDSGEPTDRRFPEDELLKRALSYGRSGFRLQFLLDCSLTDADKHPLKLDDLIVMGVSTGSFPEIVQWGSEPNLEVRDYPSRGFPGDRLHRPRMVAGNFVASTTSVLALDPAGRGLDELAVGVVHGLGGKLFGTRIKGFRGGHTPENLQAIADLAKSERVNEVLIEENFSDGTWTTLLTPYLMKTYPVTITPVKHHTQKEKRIIEALEPVLNQHRLVLSQKLLDDDLELPKDQPDLAHTYSLLYQLTHITPDRGSLVHDDRIDVLAMAVLHLAKQLGLSDVDDKYQRDQRKFEELLQADEAGYGLPRLLMGLKSGPDPSQRKGSWLRRKNGEMSLRPSEKSEKRRGY